MDLDLGISIIHTVVSGEEEGSLIGLASNNGNILYYHWYVNIYRGCGNKGRRGAESET